MYLKIFLPVRLAPMKKPYSDIFQYMKSKFSACAAAVWTVGDLMLTEACVA